MPPKLGEAQPDDGDSVPKLQPIKISKPGKDSDNKVQVLAFILSLCLIY